VCCIEHVYAVCVSHSVTDQDLNTECDDHIPYSLRMCRSCCSQSVMTHKVIIDQKDRDLESQCMNRYAVEIRGASATFQRGRGLRG
jgi:hypothetical protein